ncbi:MAG: cbb3-type cytochrome oxidase assembly protein [Leptospirales bacterium]
MKLPEGIVAYLWTATGLVSLVIIVIGIYWAYKNGQFDENIKYVIFQEEDDERRHKIEEMKAEEMKDRK